MLIEFRCANHRSIRDEQALSMAAANVSGPPPDVPREIQGTTDKILPVAAIYGPNASGKSNVLSAFSFMRLAVVHSQQFWTPFEGVPRDPFAWGELSHQPSVYEVTFVASGTRFRYGFAACDQAIQEEWLYAWPKNHQQTWFVREGQKFTTNNKFTGDSKLIQNATRPNALFLTTAVQLQHEQFMPVYEWFRSIDVVFGLPSRTSRFLSGTLGARDIDLARLIESRTSPIASRHLIEDKERELYERFRKLMLNADLGVIEFGTVSNADSGDDRSAYRTPQIRVKHLAEEDDAWLPLNEESRGTRTLFQMAMPILRAIDNGSVLLVDELEASLHPNIAEKIVREFNDPRSNPNNAQLIFTTHDTNLLGNLSGEPVIRRDEVWLTEKNPKGGTELYPLTDFKPRKHENLERGYIQGRYNAIPFLGNFILRPET